MMKRSKRMFFVALLCIPLLAACSGQFNRAQSGAAIGAAGGAIVGQAIGRNTGGTLIGAAVGTMLGYMAGNEMDKYDRRKLNQVYETGISGKPATWRNPDSGNTYCVTPGRAVTGSTGTCRTAVIDSVIDGRRERTNATACRDSHGDWQLRS